MAIVSRYCKAFLMKDFKNFSEWRLADLAGLEDNSLLYLHENYKVTKGIYQDEGIVFNEDTPQWREFCSQQLNFTLADFQNNQ
jgi:hypothetical protein